MLNFLINSLNFPNHAWGLCFKSYNDFQRRQTLPISPLSNKHERLLHIDFFCEIPMKEGIFDIKLVEVSAMSGCQRYKQPNRRQLGNWGESIKIIHLIGLGIPISNKASLQPSNRSIGINLHRKHPSATNSFLPSRKTYQVQSTIISQGIHLLYHSTTPTRMS